MNIANKISRNIGSLFGLFVGIVLFYAGMSRIYLGISSVGIGDYFTAHFMNVGLLYIYLSILILIGFSIKITYSLTKK